jgi:single-stranded-DNA-specific exonuclease
MKIEYKQEITVDEKITSQEIADLILKNRGIENTEEFFQPKPAVDINLSDFGFKKEIPKVLKLLHKLKQNNEMIVVYTDYDADGITGGTILWETLHLLGFNAMPYVPHRQKEGYGFSIIGIDAIKKDHNPGIIISVDHGITAVEQIKYAKSIGIPVIITDHHLKGDSIPEEAEAIFHIPALSGAGVAYFFAKLLYEEFGKESKHTTILKDHFQTDYLALASIGAVADLVPLVGPTRSIVKYGLDACTRSKRVGICHIIKEAGIEGKRITPYEVGFVIAPRINAIGRLEHAIDALRLLCTPKAELALELANKVGATNVQRQDMVKKAVEEAKKQVESMKKIPNIIVLTSEEWHEGIIGLIASKLTELYYRPTIIMTKGENKENPFYKGSARSIPAFHITNFMKDLSEYLISVGGHAQAGGFSLQEKNLNKFMKEIGTRGKKLISKKDLEKIIHTDLKIPLSKVTYGLIKSIEKMQPFGLGNPHPTFYSEAKVLDAKLFGKKSEHLKIIVQDPQTTRSYPLEVIAFSAADKFNQLSRGKNIEIVYQTEIDRYGGNEKVRGKLLYLV